MTRKSGRGEKRMWYRAAFFALIAGALLLSAPKRAWGDDLDRLLEDEEFDESKSGFGAPPPPPPPPPSSSMPDFGAGAQGLPPPGGVSKFGGLPPRGNDKSAPKTSVVDKLKNKPKGPALKDARIEDITDENFPDRIESFDYPNADITDIVKAISQLTGQNFIIDPGVRGKISIVAPSNITVAEAYRAFLAALAINDFTLVPYGKFYKIKNSRKAQQDAIETYSGDYFPNADIMITRIIHMKHTSAEEVSKQLQRLKSQSGEIVFYQPTNSLIVSDYGSNVERLMTIVKELDKAGFEDQLEVIVVRYAKADKLADIINQIINKDPTKPGSGGAPGFGAPPPRFRSGRGSGQGTEELSLVSPDERTNALIVLGNAAGIEKVRKLVKKLDYKLDPAEAGGVFVYYVQYGEAEKIATTLQGLTSASGAPGGGSPGGAPAFGAPSFGARPSPLDRQSVFGGDVRITADKNTNSLVITASKQDYEVVRSLLAKIDIPRSQVFVEAILMEMNTDKQNQWNPTYYYLDPSSKGIGRAGFSNGSLSSILNPTGDSGAVLGFGQGGSLKFNVPGVGEITVPSLLAFIKLVQQNTEANILSSPRVLALDNEEAEIEVGDNVPISQDQATTGSTITTNTKMEKASIKLNITPYIRPNSDVVRLKLKQSVKQVADKPLRSTKLAESTTIISDRSLNTNIVINSGDTAVLGGLIRDEDSITEIKVPILGDIPLLGWLFKSRTVKKNKMNLVVFLTPRILRGPKDGQQLLSDKTNERIDWIKRNFDGRDPYGRVMDRLPRTSKVDEKEIDAKLPVDEPVIPGE